LNDWQKSYRDLFDRLVLELLRLQAQIEHVLIDRGVTRSSYNPVADLSEILFCIAFGWQPSDKLNKGYDACDPQTELQYEINVKRMIKHNKSRQVSSIRELEEDHFDFLCVVLFDENYEVLKVAIIPRAVVRQEGKHVTHNNSIRFIARDDVWRDNAIRDATFEISEALASL